MSEYKEDPLERLARQEREKKNGSLKTVMYALIAVTVLLAAALAYVWFKKSSLVSELNIEKEELTEQIVALQQDYDNLSTEYEVINTQLDSSKEEVSQLVERIKQTDATNRAKIRQYEKELGTLRSIMRNYIVQIDSLNTLNQKLTAEADAARKDAAASKRANAELNRQVTDLTGQVAAGSVIKAAVRSGVMFGAVTQSPLAMGITTVDVLIAACAGEEVTDVPTDGYWYDSTNMDADDIAPNLYD